MNIVITGSSRGIGFETAKKLASEGHSVVVTARSKKQLEHLKKHDPARIYSIPADLTEPESIDQLKKSIADRFSSVNVLINNAGVLVNKDFEDLSMNEWERMIDVNLFASVRLTKKMLPYFSDPAHIVNISSMGGFQGSSKFKGLSAYSVSKGALSILSECLAVELADRNISVNALCLGAVQTEMLNEAFPGFDPPLSAEEMASYLADFAVRGSKYYNGKILPVALRDPE